MLQDLKILIADQVAIYENIPQLVKRIKSTNLYFGCFRLIGMLGNNVYILCTEGEFGGTGLAKFNTNSASFMEVNYCKFGLEELTYRSCYDTSGMIYFRQVL